MDAHIATQPIPPVAAVGMDYSEELIADNDEPPDDKVHELRSDTLKHSTFTKAGPPTFQRRESLLTRQLHSETEHTDEDECCPPPPRALSMQSNSSTRTAASLAELTSDDGRSTPSPKISPPFLPTTTMPAIIFNEKTLCREPTIVNPEGKPHEKAANNNTEKSVEEGLGRKRCISFACGNKAKDAAPKPAPKEVVPAAPSSPPARKCALKFVCPTRTSSQREKLDVTSEPRSDLPAASSNQRRSSPSPRHRRVPSSPRAASKSSRGSFSTVVDASSPKSVRKSHASVSVGPKDASPAGQPRSKTFDDDDSDASTEATRFHEFASSDGEPEEWVMESTCHRSRLTVNDTLRKENIIRKACEEVEDEAVEEEAAEEEEDELNEADGLDDEDGDEDVDDDEDDEDEDEDEDEDSDDGFRTDDEEGFAESDSEGEGSDEEWWHPAGRSTAATSFDHLDRLGVRSSSAHPSVPSSPDSTGSGEIPSRAARTKSSRKNIENASEMGPSSPGANDLPDSTDFVCGTLDEDRPLEQAYLNNIKQREAAKHKARPQDIDPTFPTSDPELDEEDDEDLVEPVDSEKEELMHGDLDELHGESTLRRRSSLHNPAKARQRSPPPPRRRSPAPTKKQTSNRSPPLPVALPLRRTARSPPPPTTRKPSYSPKRAASPMPFPKLRITLPEPRQPLDIMYQSTATHTASLPRGGGGFFNQEDEDSTLAETPRPGELPKRGAIDIVKGLERKRQRRKEKLYQKACAKAAAKGEKAYKVKPGKGAQRMREVALEAQRYHGKGGHIISM